MDIAARIPAMPDDALSNLRVNAERLGRVGSPVQRAAASALLPAIEAEVSARQVAKKERATAALRAAAASRPAAPAKRRTKKVVEETPAEG